jgi:hypothetical protein
MIDGLGNLNVLNRHPGQVCDGNLFLGSSLKIRIGNHMSQLHDSFFFQYTGLKRLMDLSPQETLADAVGNNNICFLKNSWVQLLLFRSVRSHFHFLSWFCSL